jgi:hypothetical protein
MDRNFQHWIGISDEMKFYEKFKIKLEIAEPSCTTDARRPLQVFYATTTTRERRSGQNKF